VPGSPSLAGSVQLRQAARIIHPTSLAISDDGVYLLFAVGGSIQLATRAAAVRAVMSAGAGASVAFALGRTMPPSRRAETGVMTIHDVPGSACSKRWRWMMDRFEIVAGLGFRRTVRGCSWPRPPRNR